MIRILHYYPKDDNMIRQHVTMLTENMGTQAEQHTATESADARTLLVGGQYNILHLHGCWRNSSRNIVTLALKTGARLVLTPHGQLEPWIKDENRWKEKLPKQLLYQRSLVNKPMPSSYRGPWNRNVCRSLTGTAGQLSSATQ